MLSIKKVVYNNFIQNLITVRSFFWQLRVKSWKTHKPLVTVVGKQVVVAAAS